MPSTNLSQKADKDAKKVKGKGKAREVVPEPPKIVEVDEEDDEEVDESEEDVDEEGMERLMKALGEDVLDDFERAQLRALGGEENEDEDEDEDEEDASEDEDEDVQGSDAEEGDEEAVEAGENQDGSEDGGSEEEDDIALDDVESVDEDAVPRQKIEIDNKIALERIRETIQLDPSLPWPETLTVSYPETIQVDVDDDLNRELAFYKQALHSANAARALAAKHQFPFTRPADYFAEMVKTDAHMERIRQRLLDETAGIKKSEEKKREREGKKFGKQVQVEKLKERERSKKEMEERLKGLKRKRKGAMDNAQADDGEFDVAVEDAISERPAKRGRAEDGKKHLPRHARDKKFGFGGRGGRREKQNTKDSTDSFMSGPRRGGGASRGGRGGRGGGSGRGGRGGKPQRLGKGRRESARSK